MRRLELGSGNRDRGNNDQPRICAGRDSTVEPVEAEGAVVAVVAVVLVIVLFLGRFECFHLFFAASMGY